MADVAIIGAGPAGLTAAYHLAKQGVSVQVLEADEQYVGGISRTVHYKCFRFDIGGHRFFSKSDRVNALWQEILGDELLERPRSSRILYGGRFYSYPLKPLEALLNLGVAESVRCVLSYLKARAFPRRDARSFEDWVSNQFGTRLFRIFFKTYTEKVWGMSCKEISADWAAQRIQGLSLWSAIMSASRAAVLPKRSAGKGAAIKTLINSFHYPRLGPGMMWERCAERVRQMGGEVLLGHRVGCCTWDSATRKWRIECRTAEGSTKTVEASHLISSAPMKELAASLRPAVASRVFEAAQSLRYRDFLTVGLILRDRNVFTDNWIYIHEASVQVGRVQNYKSWSPDMVPDPAYACYGLEYFCDSGPGLWSSTDEDLIALAKKELEQIGLGRVEDVVDGCVVRQPKAYPVYDDGYAARVALVHDWLHENFPTLHLVGRNGMHRYNNQDHAMMTALLAAENILAGQDRYDVRRVNQDAEYHEAGYHEAGVEHAAACAAG